MASTWQRVSEDAAQQPGEQYRLVALVNLPYPASFETIKKLTEFQLATTGKPITIVRWETSKPIKMRDGSSPYQVVMYYTVNPKAPAFAEAGLDPRVLVGLILLVVGSLFALALLDRHFERLIDSASTAAHKAADDVKEILNPATLAFACLAIFLLMRRS